LVPAEATGGDGGAVPLPEEIDVLFRATLALGEVPNLEPPKEAQQDPAGHRDVKKPRGKEHVSRKNGAKKKQPAAEPAFDRGKVITDEDSLLSGAMATALDAFPVGECATGTEGLGRLETAIIAGEPEATLLDRRPAAEASVARESHRGMSEVSPPPASDGKAQPMEEVVTIPRQGTVLVSDDGLNAPAGLEERRDGRPRHPLARPTATFDEGPA
jgi:hypothetical protein